MDKDKIKEKLEYYTKKKFPFTRKHFREEEVLDRETGYANYKEVNVKEVLGIGVRKVIDQGATEIVEDGDKPIGFKNDG